LAREPVGLTFSAVFSIGVVPLFGELFGDYETNVPGVLNRNVVAWDAVVINLAATAFITIPLGFAVQRSYGLLKLFKASPLSRADVILSFLFGNGVFLLFFFIVAFAANHLFYGVYLPSTIHGAAIAMVGAVLGAAALVPTGLIVAAVARSQATVAPFGQLLFIPNLLLSGLTLPPEFFPPIVQVLSKALPLTHVGVVMEAAWNDMPIGDLSTMSILVLLGYAVVSTLLVCRLLRWE